MQISEPDLRFVTLVHYRNHLGDAWMGVFFEVTRWDGGEPHNAEPHKCSALQWFSLDQLPQHTYPYTRQGLAAYSKPSPPEGFPISPALAPATSSPGRTGRASRRSTWTERPGDHAVRKPVSLVQRRMR